MQQAVLSGHDLDHVVGRLWSCRGMPQAAAALREGARRLIGCDGVTLVLREGVLCHYVDEDAIGPLWKGRRFEMKDCISGWAMLNRRQVVVEDIRADPRIPQDAYKSTFVRSLVMTPIRVREPIGALGAYWRERHEATEGEVGALQALADACAVALSSVVQAARAPGSAPRILVAAIPLTSSYVREALAGVGEIISAHTLETATQAFSSASPDLVVVGYHFDELRPYRLIQAVREKSARVPILLVRAAPFAAPGASDAHIRQSYVELGADEYVVLAPAAGDDAWRSRLLAATRALLIPSRAG